MPKLLEEENLARALQVASENADFREAIFASIREALERLITEAEIDKVAADLLRALLEALFESVRQQRIDPLIAELEIQLDQALREAGVVDEAERRLLIAILKALLLDQPEDLKSLLSEQLQRAIEEAGLDEPWKQIIPAAIKFLLEDDPSELHQQALRILLDELLRLIDELEVDEETKFALRALLRAVRGGNTDVFEAARRELEDLVPGGEILKEL